MRVPESFLCVVGYQSSSPLQGVTGSPRVTRLNYHRDMSVNMQRHSSYQHNNDNREYSDHPIRRH